jgi:hypothetical protein
LKFSGVKRNGTRLELIELVRRRAEHSSDPEIAMVLSKQMGVRIAGQRLPGRLKRSRVDSGDRIGLRDVEDERRPGEDAPLLRILAVAGLDGDPSSLPGYPIGLPR